MIKSFSTAVNILEKNIFKLEGLDTTLYALSEILKTIGIYLRRGLKWIRDVCISHAMNVRDNIRQDELELGRVL